MTRSRSLIWSFNHAIDGVVWALRTQRNMRIHVGLATLTVAGCLVLRVSRIQLVAVLIAITFVLIAELINTAVEATVDLATESFDPLAKIAKDVAAGAVLVSAINALAVAYLVLFGPARLLLSRGITRVHMADADLTVIALVLVLLATLVGKGLARQGTWLEGGWPSGHVALAFAASTIIGLITLNSGALLLGLFVSFLVAQSRVEAEIHTVWQVMAGAVIGTLVAIAVFQGFVW